MQTYSFNQHPVLKLHEVIPGMLPGIEKIITIHYDDSRKIILGRMTERKNREYVMSELDIDRILPTLNRLMEDKNPYGWFNRQNLPFGIEKKDGGPTLDIFSELQNIVLLIRVPDIKNELSDLVFLYLNENPSNFGVTNSSNHLTTDSKSIIAFILNNTVRTIVKLQYNDRSTLKSFNHRTLMVINQAETMKNEIQRTRENYGISLVKLCQQKLADRSVKRGMNYSLSESAIQKIKDYTGDIRDLELLFESGIEYAESLHLNDDDKIEIMEWHLLPPQIMPVATHQQPEKPQEEDRYAKTISLLNRLEKAAQTVKNNQLKLTGINVGKACDVPISAPAISDALFNHRSKINSLIQKYPDRWVTLRDQFKPVKNILKENPVEEEVRSYG